MTATCITNIDPTNPVQFVTGALDTFVFNLNTGSLYTKGGVTLNLPTGYVAIGGVAVMSGTPISTAASATVVITDGVAKVKYYDSALAEAAATQVMLICAVVYAKKG